MAALRTLKVAVKRSRRHKYIRSWHRFSSRSYPSCPRLGVSCAVFSPDKKRILFIKRGNEPRKGYWSLPGGLVDVGESLDLAAVREVKEDTYSSFQILADRDAQDQAATAAFCTTEHIFYDKENFCEYHYLLNHVIGVAMDPEKLTARDDVDDAKFVDVTNFLKGNLRNELDPLTPKSMFIIDKAFSLITSSFVLAR
jgi:ADP-ribose pyrophosphatase YjhB (NUDIX family)